MLTKQPDYTISELGYPLICNDKPHKKCRPPIVPAPSAYNMSTSSSSSSTSSLSSNRLLPLRETLDDYYKRILQSELENRIASTDVVAHKKSQKNRWNFQQQQQQQSNTNNYRR